MSIKLTEGLCDFKFMFPKNFSVNEYCAFNQRCIWYSIILTPQILEKGGFLSPISSASFVYFRVCRVIWFSCNPGRQLPVRCWYSSQRSIHFCGLNSIEYDRRIFFRQEPSFEVTNR